MIALSSFGQDIKPKLPRTEICIPIVLVDSMIKELIVKDHLTYTISQLDSTVRVYEHRDSVKTVIIQKLKLEKDSYEAIITGLKDLGKISDAELKDCKREGRANKIKAFFKGTAVGVVITVIIFIAV